MAPGCEKGGRGCAVKWVEPEEREKQQSVVGA